MVLNNYAPFFCSSTGISAVIDQFVRQIERDPPNGSLFSDLLWVEGWGSSAAFPAAGPDWMEGWMYRGVVVVVVGKFGAKKRIALCTTCKRVPSIVDVFQK